MAKFEEQEYVQFSQVLDQCSSPWIIAGIKEMAHPAKCLEGPLGVIDWRLHGLVSEMIKGSQLKDSKVCLFPGKQKLGQASLLVFQIDSPGFKPEFMLQVFDKMQIKEISLLSDNFNDAQIKSLESSFKKGGLKWDLLVQ